jgi:aryl-alcohol dehydrogenase-like predicted oxidoreductase
MTAPSFGPIILGGNVFGWTVSRDSAFALLDAYVDKGGRAIDTADSYPRWVPGNRGGESEEIIGAWLAARRNRDRIVIATKVAKWPEQRGLSAKNIASAVEGSLRRLQTDYIDLYFAHEDDEAVPQAEYLTAFDALVKAGKVRALGASNFTPARLASALAVSRSIGVAAFEVSQDHWNLVERDIERELVPLLERERIVETPFWSLASGSSPASIARAYRSSPRARAPPPGTRPIRRTRRCSSSSMRSPGPAACRSPASRCHGCARSPASAPRSPARGRSSSSIRCSSRSR